MADISSYLQKILEAVYGEEVRGSIYDGLSAMNVESHSAMEMAATAQNSATAAAATATEKAEAAEASAANAKGSEGQAKISEENAKASENAAADSATASANSAANALNSENNAASSESVAAQKAAEAEVSKNAAALSETNTLAAEERVKELKDTVETLAAQTTSDKNAAEAAKNSAENYRDNSSANALAAANAQAAAETAQVASEQAQSESEAARDEAKTAQAASESSRDAAQAAAQAAEDSASNAEASAETAKQYSGKSPKVIGSTWWIWNAETGQYVDTGWASELVGPTGNGIASIELTSGDHTPGSMDVYTITMTDGTTKEFQVFNGLNGTGTGDLLGEDADIEIPIDGWEDQQITLYDDLFVPAAKYKYLISAYSDSETEMIECNVRAKDITVNGEITFTCDSDPINLITVNVLRIELGANTET